MSWRFKVCSVEEAKWIDEEAGRRGIDHSLLMEDAGTAVFNLVHRVYGVYGRKYLVVAGTGNNGGDALVAARRIYAYGGSVKIHIVGDPEKYREPARKNYEIIVKMGVPLKITRSESDLLELEKDLEWSDIVIVGLIGIGLKGEVTGITRQVIEAINKSGKPVVSIDIPSGIDGNNGLVRGVAVKSTYTVTFGLPKIGNILYPGYYYCGKLFVSRLSYPPDLLGSEKIKVELNTPVKLPERVKWGHKGSFGKLLVVAGARYYYGAPYYSSYSFLKAGGGYSRLVAPRSVIPIIASRCSEVVYHPVEETEDGTLSLRSYSQIMSIIEEYGVDIVVVGPGTSLNQETQELILKLVESIDKPLIIDGDGITALSKNPGILRNRRAPTILTPHPIEFTRLTNVQFSELRENPVGIVSRVARELNSYIVLKGAHSVIVYPDGRVFINMTGNPGMAKAGMGDVLNGVIATMYGIGLRDIGEAVRMGVLIHGLAGDLVAQDIGEDGVTPDNVLEYLPRAVRILREKPEYIIEKYMPEEI